MLFLHATIITVNPSREIIDDGALLVEGSTIAAIGKSDALLKEHPEQDVYDLRGRIIIPGLVNTHMHTAQTLLRGKSSRGRMLLLASPSSLSCQQPFLKP